MMGITVAYTGPEDWGGRAYAGDAGIDLPILEQRILSPGEFTDLPSGIRLAIPEGFFGRIVARSSALRKKRIRVYEGIIDSGFRGELYSYVENIGSTATVLMPGDRLAQLILCPIVEAEFVCRASGLGLPASERGEKGFGSSDPEPLDHLHLTDLDATPMVIASDWSRGTPKEYQPAHLPVVYLGGPIDGGGSREWIDQLVLQKSNIAHFYDPLAENLGEADPRVIYDKNMKVLNDADVAFFNFSGEWGSYGFGSPIEIHMRASTGYSNGNSHHRTIVYHKDERVGVYLRKYWYDGVLVTTDWQEAMKLLRDAISAAS